MISIPHMSSVWKTVPLRNRAGEDVEAIAPVIVSASRATDIPAFYADWFRNRLEAGYCVWQNRFNGTRQYVSFSGMRAVVFWSKNPAPLLGHLPFLDERGIGYYFQFTLNDYDEEQLEPGVPPLAQRIELFKGLSRRLGRSRVVWRFDPLLLTRLTPPEKLLDKVCRIGEALRGCTERLVISFADIAAYPHVGRRLKEAGSAFSSEPPGGLVPPEAKLGVPAAQGGGERSLGAREFTEAEMRALGRELAAQAASWDMEARTCAERVELSDCGIRHNRCIDDDLLVRCFPQDDALMEFLGRGSTPPRRSLKDKGQRKDCGCIASKDIGLYNTCPHLCAYCYANTGRDCVARAARHRPDSECILE